MPGRLELMQPVFQVMIVRVVVWWFCACVSTGGISSGLSYCVLGWYPLIGCVHFISSSRILWGMWGNLFIKFCMFIKWPFAILSLRYEYTCAMVVIWVIEVGVMCCFVGYVFGGWLCSLRSMIKHLGSRLLDIS